METSSEEEMELDSEGSSVVIDYRLLKKYYRHS